MYVPYAWQFKLILFYVILDAQIQRLKNQITAATELQLQHFKNVCSSKMEVEDLKRSSAAMQELQSHLEAKVKKAEEERTTSEKKVELIEIENRELKSKVTDLESEAEVSRDELRDKMRLARTEIEELKSKLSTSKQMETKEKYERELVQHARDIEKKRFAEEIKVIEEKHLAEINMVQQDKTAVDQQLDVLSSQNEDLVEQLEQVSKRLADMEVEVERLKAPVYKKGKYDLRKTEERRSLPANNWISPLLRSLLSGHEELKNIESDIDILKILEAATLSAEKNATESTVNDRKVAESHVVGITLRAIFQAFRATL